MPERKVWSAEEDKILRHLREERGEKKWANIARIMEQEFSIQGRTGKQCRERYHNHLDSNIVSSEWTGHEEDLLFHLHEEIGNKWSAIAQKIPGRSDNCVKNHFYSKLRKAVRKLNKVIEDHLGGYGFRAIKNCMLSKIIEITESKFKSNSKEDEQFVDLCNEIKNRLFRLEVQVADEMDSEELVACKQIIEDVEEFDRSYRKNHKPSKRFAGEGEYRVYLKPPKPLIRRQNSNGSCSSEFSDDASSFLSSGSCISSCSDLSEYDGKSKNSANNSTFRGSPSTSSGNIKIENEQIKVEAQNPAEFQKFHENLIEEESENEINSDLKSHPFQYNNMFYDDTPVMARIFAPYSSMDEQQESALFKHKGSGSSDSQEIAYAEERGEP